MTDKQIRFCEEYVIDLNATQAAIRAGYSEKTANEQGSQNLAKLSIQEYISKLQKDISERNKITVDELVGILANQARFDISECFDKDGNLKAIDQIPLEHRQSLLGVDVYEERIDGSVVGQTKKIKISDRNNAIEKLMKHLGGYEKDNTQKTNAVTVFQLPDNNRG